MSESVPPLEPEPSGTGPSVRWLPAVDQRLLASRSVSRPAQEVERALHLHPDALLRLAYGEEARAGGDGTATVQLQLSSLLSWLAVPVRVRFTTPGGERPGAVISLRWEATVLPRWLPVLEGDLLVHPEQDHSRLELDGRYRPPLGLVGLLLDQLVGRKVAAATALGFLEAMGTAAERTDGAPAGRGPGGGC